jgi:hypothetical protein
MKFLFYFKFISQSDFFVQQRTNWLWIYSYKILAPAIVDNEPNPKNATTQLLETTTLDPDMYRCGHNKARFPFLFSRLFSLNVLMKFKIMYPQFMFQIFIPTCYN